ncbi:hypothetical protein [Streptomyces fulvoviolaceus]|uniref:hypothetical protein n=1 Tax=Streptomyces fulvoviolaceus TaxID=285535 RepID=UPI0021C0C863|nr:hypothetical protein [Streptomyces fulvoviolaceus]MCT9081359.1 hypothetical protein [Streptomyces fulvoviolaceus]
MSSRPLKAAITVAIAGALSLTAVPAQAAPTADPDPFAWTQLTKTYTASGKYAYAPLAVADDFMPTPCVTGMGYHYLNEGNVNETDPAKPAALLYENGPYGRKLIAVEWVVQAKDGVTRPTMFGQKFQGPDTLPVLGPSYTLHAWIYKTNPSGLFNPTHPAVKCPANPAP